MHCLTRAIHSRNCWSNKQKEKLLIKYGRAFWTKMQSNRHLHSIGSYFHSIGSYLSSIRSYFNYFVASYITSVYSSVTFHIYPLFCGNSIPSDRNYRSAVVTIWSAVKRGRLNLDLVFVWRHTTYDYMTYTWKWSRTWGKKAHEEQHQSPLDLITQNVRRILADVLNKLNCWDVDHSIDFARYRVEWLFSAPIYFYIIITKVSHHCEWTCERLKKQIVDDNDK